MNLEKLHACRCQGEVRSGRIKVYKGREFGCELKGLHLRINQFLVIKKVVECSRIYEHICIQIL